MSDGSRISTSRAGVCVFLLAGLLAGCDGGPLSGGASTDFSVDGTEGAWKTEPGTGEQAADADAQFHRHGVATGVQLRARDGGQLIEVFGSFLGKPSEPVFVTLKVRYENGEGDVFERSASVHPDDRGSNGIQWQRLEVDHEAGTGHAKVLVDIPVCFDDYSGPLEYETRCHQLTGNFDTPLVHNPRLRVIR